MDNEGALSGTATLNWSVDTSIDSWDGVVTGGTPTRITELDLPSNSLTGSIPAELGTLSGLTVLDLSGNQLTGEIPHEIGWLFNLTEIGISGNSLTGCIPVALEDVAANDFSSMSLLFCQPPPPENLAAGTPAETNIPLTWDSVSNASRYRVEYRLDRVGDWAVHDETTTTASHTADSLNCETAYQFRVSAYGSGTNYAQDWSEPSLPVSEATTECASPVFDATSYDFSVVVDSGVGTVVGDVTASGSSDDTVSYEITGGNDDGLFSIDESSGRITLAAAVDANTATPILLTVEARDGNDNAATVTVTVTITAMDYTTLCSNGTVIPNPGAVPHLVRDCAALLGTRDSLAGTTPLNWSGQLPIADWEGVEISETPLQRVSAVKLRGKSLAGSIPRSLGNLTGLTKLDLFDNDITGAIPTEIGNLTALEYLNLGWNDLTGPIPKEIGNLTALTQLWLGGNDLTGPIPKEIGNLTALTDLWLGFNDLTGTIPKEIVNLTTLTQLRLSRNDLTGPIPKEIGNLTALTQLWLSLNDLTGTIPTEIGNLTALTELWLYANDLTGTIPTEIGSLTALTSLLLNDNRLGGTIPAEIGDLTALTHLWLIRNELTGSIPKEIGNLTALTWLLLGGNELTGCIPGALKNIRNHDLASLDLIYCPSVLVSNANPQEGDEVELRVEVEGATSYQWQVKQNDTWTDVAGETAATYTVTHQTAGDRTYRVV